jgi:hypothetical protein
VLGHVRVVLCGAAAKHVLERKGDEQNLNTMMLFSTATFKQLTAFEPKFSSALIIHSEHNSVIYLPTIMTRHLKTIFQTFPQLNSRLVAAFALAALSGAVHGFIVSAFIGLATASLSGGAAACCAHTPLKLLCSVCFY